MKYEPVLNRYWQEARAVEALGASPVHVAKAYSDANALSMWEYSGVESNTGAIAAYGWGGGLQRANYD